MKFTPLASSSKGNAYLVEAEGVAPLLLEAGIPIRQLREKLHFGLSGLAGCLISHEHMDHAKAATDLLAVGIDCYMGLGTAVALKLEDHHGFYLCHPNVSFSIGDWRIKPFRIEHDAADPLGFLIQYGYEVLCFIPDTAYVTNRFSTFTILAVECNHIAEILTKNILSGALPAVVGHRVRRNHMSLETLIEMLKANDLSSCRQIHLIHLSDGNSDEARMIKTVQEATGIPCYAA